jgi:hypothetical protein
MLDQKRSSRGAYTVVERKAEENKNKNKMFSESYRCYKKNGTCWSGWRGQKRGILQPVQKELVVYLYSGCKSWK